MKAFAFLTVLVIGAISAPLDEVPEGPEISAPLDGSPGVDLSDLPLSMDEVSNMDDEPIDMVEAVPANRNGNCGQKCQQDCMNKCVKQVESKQTNYVICFSTCAGRRPGNFA